MENNPLFKHLNALISYPSITPNDEGAQRYIAQCLEQLGFDVSHFSCPPVSNLWACIGNKDGPLLVFAGHTDVVAPGEIKDWHTPPFNLIKKGNHLYGRGVADMKGSIAAMLIAIETLIKENQPWAGRIGLLITSGEEGDQYLRGTPYVMEQLKQRNIHPDYCLVGEPSSIEKIGDVIKVGRRGSLSATIDIYGKQGHVAYPHLAANPIHLAAPFINELTTITLDEGDEFFPPSSLQITNIQAGSGQGNVIPGLLNIQFNIRYSMQFSKDKLIQTIEGIAQKHKLHCDFKWLHNGPPFLTAKGKLLKAGIEAVHAHTGYMPKLSTDGGTSDGRFIAPYDIEVIELGPENTTIHQVNESVSFNSLMKLAEIYAAICRKLII